MVRDNLGTPAVDILPKTSGITERVAQPPAPYLSRELVILMIRVTCVKVVVFVPSRCLIRTH